MEQSVDGTDSDEGAEADDLDDLAVDDLLHLRIEGERVELGLVVDPGLVGDDRTLPDIGDLDHRDHRADGLVDPTLEFVLEQLLNQLRRDIREMLRRYLDRVA